MGIRVALNHKTCYKYPKPVWLSPHVVRLRPAPHCRTADFQLFAEGDAAASISSTGSRIHTAIAWRGWFFPKKTTEFSVVVDLVAELTVTNPFDFFLEKYAEEFPFTYEPTLLRELVPYLEVPPPGPRLQALIARAQARKDAHRRLPGRS